MRFIKTLTIELNDEGKYIGDIWGIKEERAEELQEMLAGWIKQSSKWSELYKRIFSELDGNEAIYTFGMLNYLWGHEDGKAEAMAEIITTMEAGRAQ